MDTGGWSPHPAPALPVLATAEVGSIELRVGVVTRQTFRISVPHGRYMLIRTGPALPANDTAIRTVLAKWDGEDLHDPVKVDISLWGTEVGASSYCMYVLAAWQRAA